jgi:hypothetical protein
MKQPRKLADFSHEEITLCKEIKRRINEISMEVMSDENAKGGIIELEKHEKELYSEYRIALANDKTKKSIEYLKTKHEINGNWITEF